VPDRDRDTQGRARNARPRDTTGRPLPPGATGTEQLPDNLTLTPTQSIVKAQQLLDDGLPFPAHEVLEAAWKAAPTEERELWRGLAQLAVGLTHLQRGNTRGAVALLSRAADRISTWTGPPPHGLDTHGLRRHAETLAQQVERDGIETVGTEALRPRLRL
jgi:hypothetical protein